MVPILFPFVVGQTEQLRVPVSEGDVRRFADLSGDHAPIHCDPAFARRHGFEGCVVHGAYLASLTSQLIGMRMPGSLAVLQRMDLAFHAPCYAPCVLILQATVRQVSESVSSLLLDITIRTAEGVSLATGKTWHKVLSGEASL